MQPAQVLVVEDNPGDVVLIKKCLENCRVPLKITVANDGESAVNLVPGLAPDLIVLDLNLPYMNGDELLT